MEGGLPEVQELVYLHLLPDTPLPVPWLGPRQLPDVPQDAGGLGHGEVSIDQDRQLFEGQLRPLSVLSSAAEYSVRTFEKVRSSPEELEGDLLVGDLSTVEEEQRSSGGVRYSVAKQLYLRHLFVFLVFV